MEKQGILGYMLGKILGLLLYGLLFAYPIMLLLNYALSPTALGFLFGGYATFWKTYAFMVITAYLFK